MSLILVSIIVFCASTAAIVYLRPLAIKANLVDIPNERKSHSGHVPLIGGMSTFIGIVLALFLSPEGPPQQYEYILVSFLLVLVGVIDDKLDISAVSRLVVIATLSVWLVEIEGISLNYLGDIFGVGSVYLSSWSLLFTSFAVIGCITAFNMIDGIDGLLGVLASVSIGSLGLLFWLSGDEGISQFCLLFVVSMLPYVCFNLGVKSCSKYKVFMGDSGSFLVGFTIIWLLVFATQHTESLHSVSMKPVTALWIIAIPLMDMTRVMFRRLFNVESPFKADRTHIHHVLLAYGMSSQAVLCVIGFAAVVIAACGVFMELNQVRESTSLIAFLIIFFGYTFVVSMLSYKTPIKDIEEDMVEPVAQSEF